jgi:hypothetical protein
MTIPDPEQITLVLAVLTLPWAVAFVALYSRDGWQRHWFGRSLMAIAVAFLISCGETVVWRLYGPDPALLRWLLWINVVVWSLGLFGMSVRTLVLWSIQRREAGPRRGRSTWRH